jgi:glycosyltransferase involved in cell wall biosynthesis
MEKGGAERVLSMLLSNFSLDSKLCIHLLQLEKGLSYDLPLNVTRVVLSGSGKSEFRKFVDLPFQAWQVSRYIKNHRINTVMSFLYRANYINILAKVLGVEYKAILNVRSTTSRYLSEGIRGKINLFLIKHLFNRSDLIISNSMGVDRDLKSLMNITSKTRVIYNPVDISAIKTQKNICMDIKFNFKTNVKYIISVGRIVPLKRNKDLIDAFHQLQKEDSNLEVIFLGDGILRDDLMTYCTELNIKRKVHFLGNVSNPFYYLSRSDIFVLNSQVEGFPNVLVEAMACGLPVISSDCMSGPREILRDSNYGHLYSVGNITRLIDKIRIVLYGAIDKDDVMVDNLKKLKSFDARKMITRFREVL